MRVYLLRHGIAEDYSPSGTDADRSLTAEGVQRLELACNAYRRLVRPPLQILASPLRRAQETAAVLARVLGQHQETSLTEALTPAAPVAQVLERLQRELLSGTEAIALVGHEPHLGNLLGLLLTGSERASVPLKRGMMVGLEIDAPQSMLARLTFALGQKSAITLG